MDPFNFPSRSLHGRVAIVTGADFNKRITNGSAIAIMLARDGCNVICIGTPPSDIEQPDSGIEHIERTVTIINRERAKHIGPGPINAAAARIPGRAVAFGCDITNENECDDAVQFALDTFGRLDVLVNNAGINGPPGTAVDVNMNDWAYAMDFNVASMVHMVKFAVPAMQVRGSQTGKDMSGKDKSGKEKSGGSIINMSSVTGMRGGAAHLLHPTTKSAIIGMSKTMAAHFGAKGVRVNCVCPGIQYAPATFGTCGEDALEHTSLLGTEGTSGHMAAAVVFLASDLSRWITGTEIVVDAGATSVVDVKLQPASNPDRKPDSRPDSRPDNKPESRLASVPNFAPPDGQRAFSTSTHGVNNGNSPAAVRTDGNDMNRRLGPGSRSMA